MAALIQILHTKNNVSPRQLCLSALNYERLDFVVNDELGASIIWVRDAHVYDFHGTSSLSFRLASQGSSKRLTARITNRITRKDSDLIEIQLYETKLKVSIGKSSHTIVFMLCESGIYDAPAILTSVDMSLFDQP